MMPNRSILALDLRHHRVGSQWQWKTVKPVDQGCQHEHSSDPLGAARGLLNGMLISAAVLIVTLMIL